MKINWAQKLSSRKFWLAVAGFITALLYGLNVAETHIAQVTSIIMAGGLLAAYILAEGWVDVNRGKE